MLSVRVSLLAGAVLIGAATASPAAERRAAEPQWHTTIVTMPDGSDIEIEYAGDIEPRVRVAMPVVQGASPAAVDATGTPVSYGGIPRARRLIQPPVAAVPSLPAQAPMPGLLPAPTSPLLVMPEGAPKGSTYEYTLITTGVDGKTCSQRTEWTSQGKNREPNVKRTDRGEGCAGLIAPPPVAPRIVPVDPGGI